MQRVEKENCSSKYTSHNFPDIRKTLQRDSEQHATVEDAFRPLYQLPHGTSAKHDPANSGHEDSQSSEHVTIEELRVKSFDKGFETGQTEASKLVKKGLEAPIRKFIDENSRYSDCFCKLTENYASRTVNLAFEIAKKILGDHFQPTMDNLEPMCLELNSYLKQQYRLSIAVNSENFGALTDLIKCVNPHWQHPDALNIIGHADTPAGNVQSIAPEDNIENIANMFGEKLKLV